MSSTRTNMDINEYLRGAIADSGERDSPATIDRPSPNGDNKPRFRRLRSLVAEGNTNAIVGKLSNGLGGLPPPQSNKDKGSHASWAPRPATSHPGIARPRHRRYAAPRPPLPQPSSHRFSRNFWKRIFHENRVDCFQGSWSKSTSMQDKYEPSMKNQERPKYVFTPLRIL